MSDSRQWDVMVLGAGIVGISTALALQEDGLSVLLIEAETPCDAASRVNAAAISPSSILPLAGPGLWRALPRYLANLDPALRLRWRDLPGLSAWTWRFLARANQRDYEATASAMAPLLAGAWSHHVTLAQAAGMMGHFRQTGWTKLWRVPQHDGHRTELALFDALGVGVEVLDRDAIAALEPGLASVYHHAHHIPDARSADNPQAVGLGYLALFRARGGEIAQARILALHPAPDVWQALAQDRDFIAREVVVAAGAGSAALVASLGVRLPLIAERGYSTHLPPEGLRLGRPVIDCSRGFVMTPMEEGIRVSTGVELMRPSTPPNLAQLRLATTEARRVLGAAKGELPAWRSGMRPSLPDGLPAIGMAPGHAGLWLATGHGHVGFATAPITGAILRALRAGRTPPIAAEAFDPARFAS